MYIKGGYILQPRIIDGSELIHQPPVSRELWLYLLRNVNHKSNEKYARGSGFFNLEKISEDLHWYVGFKKMKYSKPTISKALHRLCVGSMTATMKATRGIIITVCNYDYYQDPKNYEGYNEGSMKGSTKVRTKNKKDKNDEEKENIYVLFTMFLKQYPGRKKSAETEFANFSKKFDLEIVHLLLPALEKEKQYRIKAETEKQFVPPWKYLSIWINQKCWEQVFEEIKTDLFRTSELNIPKKW